MKKFLSGVKKNIFYISLITGMAVLVTVLGLYNAKTNSKEKNIVIGQNTPYGDTSESGMQTKETLSGKDKNAGTEDGTRNDVERDATADSTYAEDSAADLDGGDTDAEITKDDAGRVMWILRIHRKTVRQCPPQQVERRLSAMIQKRV